METGTIDIKLRPIKLAFLVDPKDGAAILEAIQISTCLWGGAFNPIIPIFNRIPRTWTRDDSFYRFNSKKIFEGYLDAYDPDYLVPLGKCANRKFDVKNRKIIKASDILSEMSKNGVPHYGVGIFEILRDFISKELKFQRRKPIEFYLPNLDRPYKIFLASVFGKLPEDIEKTLKNEGWKEALGAIEENITLENYQQLLEPQKIFLRRVTYHEIENSSAGGIKGGDCLFFLDAKNTYDVIDFWNLRAIGWTVIPIAKQVASENATKKLAEEFIDEHSGPSRHNPDFYIHANILKGRSIKTDEVSKFVDSLNISKDEKARGSRISIWSIYPRIWDEWAKDKDGVVCRDIESRSETHDFSGAKENIAVKTVDPEFASKHGFRGNGRFANEVGVRVYADNEIYAEVMPEGGENLSREARTFGLEDWKFSKRETVYFPQHVNSSIYVSIPKAENVFRGWMKDQGFDVELSSSGYIAKQMAKRLGGIHGINTLNNEELIKLLREMEGGKTMNKEAFMGRMARAANSRVYKKGDGIDFLKHLTEVNMFRLGATVKCPVCRRDSWFTLRDLDYQIQCTNCLDEFDIPSHSPDDIEWSYRPFGPFNLPNGAHGVYSTLLTLRVFANLSRGAITPMMSFLIKNASDMEVDLGLFFKESKYNKNADTRVIFAESKGYNKFEKKDVDRMATLAKKFPGAVIVFSTLKDSLTNQEKRLLKPLVNKGRRYWKAEQPYNPVLILTKTELFADFELQHTWREAGGKHKPFGERYFYNDQLLQACDATQQLYLDLKPWHDWLREKLEKRRKKVAPQSP